MRATIAPPFFGHEDAEPDADTVLVDPEVLVRMMAEDLAPSSTPIVARVLGGGPVASPDYMTRVAAAADRERRARLGRRAPP